MKRIILYATAVFIITVMMSFPLIDRIDRMEGTVGRNQVLVTGDDRPIIVIDAGHGGFDGGAQFQGVKEKDITLKIAEELESILKEYPVNVIMTRTEDCGLYTDDGRTVRQKKREDLLNRKKLMEESGAVLSISIHLNSYAGSEKIYGAQVFYPACQKGRTQVQKGEHTSKEYAEAVQKSLELSIPDDKVRKVMPKNDILIFQNTKANIILVECGFLSNPAERELLQKSEYQRILSQGIWKGINEILCLKKESKTEVIDSTNKAS